MTLPWTTVRDNYLTFWTGGNWELNPAAEYTVSAFAPTQRTQIENAIELLYRSPTFQAMINTWITAHGGRIQIGGTDDGNRADAVCHCLYL